MRKGAYLLLLTLFFTVGCKELKSIEEDIDRLVELKNEVKVDGPYSFEDQVKLSDYFSGLNLLVKKIDEHPKGKKGLPRFIKKNGLVNTCEHILLDKESWELIKSNCWKGEYFICSEDILDFESSLILFASNLDEDRQKTFLTNQACAGNWSLNEGI